MVKKMKKGDEGMDSYTGVYSYRENPMPAPSQVKSMAGPGSNPDQQKVNRLLQKAHAEKESLRGKSGM